jgi:hypothetical protein
MSLRRVPAAAVKIGELLDRADTPGELDAIWSLNDCDGFTGAARTYLDDRRRQIAERQQRNADSAHLARAS